MRKKEKFTISVYAAISSLLELCNLYVLVDFLSFKDSSWNIPTLTITFLLIQFLKIIIFIAFKKVAVSYINGESRRLFNDLKETKRINYQKNRKQDDRAAVEIISITQEFGNSVYAIFNKQYAIVTLVFFTAYGIYSEPNIIFIFLLGTIFYFINKWFLIRKRDRIIEIISEKIKILGDDIGSIISNSKMFFFDKNSLIYDNQVMKTLGEIRTFQGQINVINYSIRPSLEAIAIIFFSFLVYNGMEIKSLASIIIIVLKSVPLISMLNYSNSSINLSAQLNEKLGLNTAKVADEQYEITHWNQLNFTFKNLKFTLKKNQKIYLKGTSGSGKSTMLEMLCGLINANFILNIDSNQYKKWNLAKSKTCFINQHLKPWTYEICDFIDLSQIDKKKLTIFFSDSEINQLDNKGRKLNELSGGQFQRLYLLKMINENSEFFIIDEGLSGVDNIKIREILGLLVEMPITLIYTSHNRIDENLFDSIWKIS